MSIECVTSLTGYDVVRRGRPHIASKRRPFCRFLDRLDAVNRIIYRPVAGASAEIALHHPRNIQAVFFAETCDGHDGSRGAKAALKSSRIDERLLDRMQTSIARETFDSGYFVAFGAEGGNETAMHRLAIEPDSARAAIAGVATLLHPEPSHVTQESTQALARLRLFCEILAVNYVAHDYLSPSSRRISSAK